MCTSPGLRASVSIERDGLARALKFLKRARTRAEHVRLSYDGHTMLVDCGRCKAEVVGVGGWDVVVILRRESFMRLLPVARLLPKSVEMAVAGEHLRVHSWSLEIESIMETRTTT
jgi:hypothetical protein